MSERKRKKLSSQSLVCETKRNELNVEDDSNSRSLNDFPDAILSHILSFLSTKCAVQTSVLSRRWKNMWTYRSNLDFEEETWQFSRYDPQEKMMIFYGSEWHTKGQPRRKNRNHFFEFVDRVLRFHALPRIQKFSLSCDVKNDAFQMKQWISTAVMRDAREINVHHDQSQTKMRDVFPDCLFSSKTIEILKIETDLGIVAPSQVCLPNLKVLNLKNVTFIDSVSANLLFASPALEELVMYNCKWEQGIHDVDVLIISAPKLRSLSIDESREPYGAFLNFVKISAPALEIFNFRGEFIKEHRLCNSSSIFKATLGFHRSRILKDINVNHFNEILSSLQSVKYLQLSAAVVGVLSYATVPVFKTLTSLEITEYPLYLDSETLGVIHNKCPILETLRLPMGIWKGYDFDCLLNSKLICFSSTLKNIIIGGFMGFSLELAAMEILLEKAAILENVEISFAKNIWKKEEIEKLLSAIPRASKSCKLCFR